MSRIIVYSDYISPEKKSHLINNLEYISTRDGVALNLEDSNYNFILDENYKEYSISNAQRSLINEILLKYPGLESSPEYKELKEESNMLTASKFITSAMERIRNANLSNSIYLNYISERPGVEKYNGELHGLFDKNGIADLEQYKNELENNQSNVYRHVISLKRMDAEMLGYDQRESWENLIRAKVLTLAKEMKIPDSDFKWVCAFHNEGHHPHVHLMCWSESGKFGYLDEKGIEKFKSALANTIFDTELWLVKELKNEYRDELENSFKEEIENKLNEFKEFKITEDEENMIYKKINELSSKVNTLGKPFYAYQKKEVKLLVDDLVSEILQNEKLNGLVTQYASSHQELIKIYQSNPEKINEEIQKFLNRLIHPEQKDRKVLHNVILKTAYEFRNNTDKQIEIINKCIQLDTKFLSEKNLIDKYSVVLQNYDIDIDQSITVLEQISKDRDLIIESLFNANHLNNQEKGIKMKDFFSVNRTLEKQIIDDKRSELFAYQVEKTKLPGILFARLHGLIKDRTFEEQVSHFRRLNLIHRDLLHKKKQTISKNG